MARLERVMSLVPGWKRKVLADPETEDHWQNKYFDAANPASRDDAVWL